MYAWFVVVECSLTLSVVLVVVVVVSGARLIEHCSVYYQVVIEILGKVPWTRPQAN
jgi:hypothetical protein